MKITTQFIDNCSNCNDLIREKSIAYRGEHGDLFCINCNDNGITRKKVIQKNLEIAFNKPDSIPEREVIIKRVYENAGMVLFEFLKMQSMSTNQIRDCI